MTATAADRFALLCRRWAPRIFNHFRRLSWSVDDASDLTSEVFAIAWERLPQMRGPERPEGWLWSIAHSRAINRARDEQRRRDRDRAAVAMSAPEGTETPDTGRRLGRAVSALAPEERQLLLWREYSGLAYAEIATLTGQSVDGVRAALYRARRRLREEYLKRLE
ncbi:MAG: sigma-70 family RNA polymerase sigma factor [candidate division Zixibacteria bacterium]|nr:sigma-70 family RNA polymerase sigma factor [candidate division Zixibacteria bacterium]